ncbi:1-acyl-sn-glycerol-3-phosphate acyltransferase [Rhodobacteraceae bacterium 2CG4]|uniref:1-acyl-sn-glycerol-3-phosphate acyltransferase n=2 Tax=Halovulum marinum TaxID=2662447 RepID=A0A6L5YUP0_9RHOB|nr:1-acyl-sn-glycerol-3-phosphate acyltransferase [Halovulum marinum]
MLVMGLLCAPLALASPRGAHWSVRSFCRIGLVMLRLICGLRTEVRGPVPTGDVIVASKHQSFLDILIHVAALPRSRFIMKKELRWAPILGLYAMRMGSTPVARGRKGQAVTQMVQGATRNATEPGQLVIYPQGTRVAPGAVLPYKVGAGVLYQRMGKPCVPAATNAGVFWGRKSWLRRPGLAVVEYLPEIPTGLSMEAFVKRLESEIEPVSNALMAEAGHRPERHRA